MNGMVLLSLTCATGDAEPIVEALRAATSAPIHVRDETVRGLDFADAGTAERVTGALRRIAIELVVAADEVAPLTQAVDQARRRLPVRWLTLPVLDRGRFP
jgi:hypothetical protein